MRWLIYGFAAIGGFLLGAMVVVLLSSLIQYIAGSSSGKKAEDEAEGKAVRKAYKKPKDLPQPSASKTPAVADLVTANKNTAEPAACPAGENITAAKDEVVSAKEEVVAAKDEIISAKDEVVAAKDEIVAAKGKGTEEKPVKKNWLSSLFNKKEAVKEEKPVKREMPDAQLFSLSRDDVFDHIEDMRENPGRFPKLPNVKEKTDDAMPDYLRCGERCFGLMYERNELVFNFVLRLSDDAAKRYGEYHSVQSSDLGENWYNLVADQSFESKKEIYQILDESYDFTLRKYSAERDEDSARAEQLLLEQKAEGNKEHVERSSAVAEQQYRASLERFKAEYYSNFIITRREIAADIRAMDDPNITVVERYKQPQLPVSIKYKGKAFAMLHGTDMGIIMTVKLDSEYADNLTKKHPELVRARFPKGPSWYLLPIDGAFADKESVYRVLMAARAFTEAQDNVPKSRTPFAAVSAAGR